MTITCKTTRKLLARTGLPMNWCDDTDDGWVHVATVILNKGKGTPSEQAVNALINDGEIEFACTDKGVAYRAVELK